MTVANNPAGRLFEILKQFQRSSDNTLLVSVIANAFSVDAKDTAQILEIYLELLLLVRQAKADVLKISGINQKLYLEPFNSLETAFSQNSLHHNWSNFKQHVGPSVMKGLEFCADTMSERVGEKAIEQEEIDNLQTIPSPIRR
ncbi:MAG: hypothetical protein HYZ24_16040 [Chloroflexi bacterium]|nr:hypothetical protein [Chloroflexota bacterium]